MKKDLSYIVVLHFLGKNKVTFVLLMDVVALEGTRLAGLSLTSPVTDLNKKTMSRYSSQ